MASLQHRGHAILEHGGRLRRAAQAYTIPLAHWLDLSTGVSPFAWPVPAIPEHVWQRLPEDDDDLADCAAAYYGAPQVLPVAGSQAAIQALPLLRAPSRVGVLTPGYAEHAQAWQRAGHQVVPMSAAQLLHAGETLDVAVLIHPNNPCADRFDPDKLLQLHARLASRGGWLVIDEAFMDATPQHSVCGYTQRPGLVVLRSVGKFFGMAGARAGFVCADRAMLDACANAWGHGRSAARRGGPCIRHWPIRRGRFMHVRACTRHRSGLRSCCMRIRSYLPQARRSFSGASATTRPPCTSRWRNASS